MLSLISEFACCSPFCPLKEGCYSLLLMWICIGCHAWWMHKSLNSSLVIFAPAGQLLVGFVCRTNLLYLFNPPIMSIQFQIRSTAPTIAVSHSKGFVSIIAWSKCLKKKHFFSFFLICLKKVWKNTVLFLKCSLQGVVWNSTMSPL